MNSADSSWVNLFEKFISRQDYLMVIKLTVVHKPCLLQMVIGITLFDEVS